MAQHGQDGTVRCFRCQPNIVSSFYSLSVRHRRRCPDFVDFFMSDEMQIKIQETPLSARMKRKELATLLLHSSVVIASTMM